MDQPSTAAAWRARADLTIVPYGLVGAPPKFCTSDQQSPHGFQLQAAQLNPHR
jgi:hypothetical protein